MTSGIIRSDQVAVKRIFSLLSRPLNDFNELYYPSFAEWVTSKVHKQQKGLFSNFIWLSLSILILAT